MVVISQLWGDRRNWPWPWIHRSGGGPGEVVPGSPRTHYRDRGGRIRCRRAYYGACGYAADSKRRGPEHIRLSRHRLSDRHSYNWIVYAESARWLEACGLDTDNEP